MELHPSVADDRNPSLIKTSRPNLNRKPHKKCDRRGGMGGMMILLGATHPKINMLEPPSQKWRLWMVKMMFSFFWKGCFFLGGFYVLYNFGGLSTIGGFSTILVGIFTCQSSGKIGGVYRVILGVQLDVIQTWSFLKWWTPTHDLCRLGCCWSWFIWAKLKTTSAEVVVE